MTRQPKGMPRPWPPWTALCAPMRCAAMHQMNVHDSGRTRRPLEDFGPGPRCRTARCRGVQHLCGSENADNKLYGHLGHLRATKSGHPGTCRSRWAGVWHRKIAGKYCVARPVDVVFSTTTSARCRCCWNVPG